MARQLKPRTPFAERLISARSHLSRDDFAVLLGVPKTTLGGWERGANFPPPEMLTKISDVLRVSLDWLIAGRSAPQRDAPAASPTTAASATVLPDAELLGRICDGITAVYKEAGARLAPLDLGRLISRILTELMSAYESDEERLVGLKLALEQLRRDIHKAAAGEDRGKHSA